MGRRLDLMIGEATTGHWNGAGTQYIIQAANGYYYMVYIDGALDVAYRKSLDGITWGPTTLCATAGSTTQLALWYDRWTDPTGGLGDYIHMAFSDSGNDDIFYRTINTASSDALSTQVAVFAGASTAAGGHMSITRAVSGNVYIKGVIDAGAEGDFFRLTQANFPNGAWDNRAVDEAIATKDQMILLPDYDAGDTSDIMAIFWDASANEISRKLYDNSADTWAEQSIAGSMTELDTATAFANFDVAPDPTNTRHVLVAWSGTDTNGADLRCWTVDAGTITEVGTAILNSGDDQGLCTIGIDVTTGYWHVWYGGKSDGSETWVTALNVYKKVSTDGGSTWGAETKVNDVPAFTLRRLYCCPRFTGDPVVAYVRDGQADDLLFNVDATQPRATYVAGVM